MTWRHADCKIGNVGRCVVRIAKRSERKRAIAPLDIEELTLGKNLRNPESNLRGVALCGDVLDQSLSQ
jgi:hypothetical protein